MDPLEAKEIYDVIVDYQDARSNNIADTVSERDFIDNLKNLFEGIYKKSDMSGIPEYRNFRELAEDIVKGVDKKLVSKGIVDCIFTDDSPTTGKIKNSLSSMVYELLSNSIDR